MPRDPTAAGVFLVEWALSTCVAAVWCTLGSYVYASASRRCEEASLCGPFLLLVWLYAVIACLAYPAISRLFVAALDFWGSAVALRADGATRLLVAALTVSTTISMQTAEYYTLQEITRVLVPLEVAPANDSSVALAFGNQTALPTTPRGRRRLIHNRAQSHCDHLLNRLSEHSRNHSYHKHQLQDDVHEFQSDCAPPHNLSAPVNADPLPPLSDAGGGMGPSPPSSYASVANSSAPGSQDEADDGLGPQWSPHLQGYLNVLQNMSAVGQCVLPFDLDYTHPPKTRHERKCFHQCCAALPPPPAPPPSPPPAPPPAPPPPPPSPLRIRDDPAKWYTQHRNQPGVSALGGIALAHSIATTADAGAEGAPGNMTAYDGIRLSESASARRMALLVPLCDAVVAVACTLLAALVQSGAQRALAAHASGARPLRSPYVIALLECVSSALASALGYVWNLTFSSLLFAPLLSTSASAHLSSSVLVGLCFARAAFFAAAFGVLHALCLRRAARARERPTFGARLAVLLHDGSTALAAAGLCEATDYLCTHYLAARWQNDLLGLAAAAALALGVVSLAAIVEAEGWLGRPGAAASPPPPPPAPSAKEAGSAAPAVGAPAAGAASRRSGVGGGGGGGAAGHSPSNGAVECARLSRGYLRELLLWSASYSLWCVLATALPAWAYVAACSMGPIERLTTLVCVGVGGCPGRYPTANLLTYVQGYDVASGDGALSTVGIASLLTCALVAAALVTARRSGLASADGDAARAREAENDDSEAKSKGAAEFAAN